MNIIQLLTPKIDVSVLYNDYTVRQGLEKLRRCGYSAIPVIKRNGEYAGCVSEGDFLWQIVDGDMIRLRDEEKCFIRDIIRKDFNQPVKISASPDDLVERIVNQNFVPIVDDRNKFIGIITRKDIIKYLISRR